MNAPWKSTAPVVSSSRISEADLVRDNLDQLSERDVEFATSLLRAYDSERGASEKQAHWLGVMAERVAQKLAKREPEPMVTGHLFERIVEMFDSASLKLKYPKVRGHFRAHGEELPLKLSRAGGGARYPGSINVSDGGPFGENVWYGRIHSDGTFEPNRRINIEEMRALVTYLTKFNTDPESHAKAHGQEYGECCFCARELTDHRSLDAGYGPVCAERYGLAWGE